MKLWQMRNCFLWLEQKKGFLEIDSSPGKDQGRLLKWQCKRFKNTAKVRWWIGKHILKGKWSTVGKMLSSSMACNEGAPHEKELTEQQTSMLSYSEKLPQPPLISTTSTVCRSAAINLKADPSTKRLWLSMAQITLSIKNYSWLLEKTVCGSITCVYFSLTTTVPRV